VPDSVQYVYIKATDSHGHVDEAPFRLKIGGLDDGADSGDPHLTTTNGKHYDFQAAGEFTLLRDFDGLEIQARQTPVATAAPVNDPYSGLTSCVSINTAIAAQLGDHRLAFQPAPTPVFETSKRFVVFVDGAQREISTRGLNLAPGARVVAYPLSDGSTSYEVDYPDSTVLTVTPWFWTAHQVWLLDVGISKTPAFLGVMGDVPAKTWLPALPEGSTVGSMPASLSARYSVLYKKFADAWRVSNTTSLFVYAPGTSTASYTDRNWPPKSGPCKVNPRRFGTGLARPVGPIIKPKVAERFCVTITVAKLHADCVFDVSATGDPKIVGSYLRAQDLQLRATTVRVDIDKEQAQAGVVVTLTASVASLARSKRTPTGSVTFLVDGKRVTKPVTLDRRGQARARLTFAQGAHQIMSAYTPGEGSSYLPSTSPIVVHTAFNIQRG
jgi:hypothetical protein